MNRISLVMKVKSLIAFLVCFLLLSCSGGDSESAGFKIGVPSQSYKKVYIHYLPWFGGDTSSGRHWIDGTVNTPLIGYYDSKSWATHFYHILLTSALGVDGAMINVKTDYDQEAFDIFLASLKRVHDIYPDFDYSVFISLDDQDMTVSLAKEKLTLLKQNMTSNINGYLHRDGEPVIFIWMYDYLNSSEYRSAVKTVFDENTPVLIKNDIDIDATPNVLNMDGFYPWVKGFQDDGSDWGEEYLDWFYETSFVFKQANKQRFVVGAAWPGFDDRNVTWGQHRWIDRKDGEVYKNTWEKVLKYTDQDTPTLDTGIEWVVIETWNDFNEGSEIEPVVSNDTSERFKYAELTAEYIARFKGRELNIELSQELLLSVVEIYYAARLIEQGERSEADYYPKLQKSIKRYLQGDSTEALKVAREIIDG
ncbi:MAG: hypothetical protein JXR16_06580 [Bermanella sp.]